MHTFKELMHDRFTPKLQSAWESFLGEYMFTRVDEIQLSTLASTD